MANLHHTPVQVLVTFSYWLADESWAVHAWEAIISTLRLSGPDPDLVPDTSRTAPDRE